MANFWTSPKRVRGGTWIFAVGAFFLVTSFVLIGVFWRWWYRPEINVPMRVLAIASLVTGVCMTVGGLVNNYLCALKPYFSKLWGDEHIRGATWFFIFACLLGEIGIICTSIGFIHWFTKEVNLPLQGCGIAFTILGVLIAISCFLINYGQAKAADHSGRGATRSMRPHKASRARRAPREDDI